MSRRGVPKPDLVVLDFDGVLTDNRVLIMEDGREAVMCNRSDGLGVKMLKQNGIRVLILSTETNRVVRMRAAKLKVPVLQSIENKACALKKCCLASGTDLNKVMYVGNDMNDLEAMKLVGFPVAVADSHAHIKAVAWKVTRRCGGSGVVQEIVEDILKLSYTEDKVEKHEP